MADGTRLKDLTSLLNEYGDIFKEPEGLPPVRGIEHQIVLKLQPYKQNSVHLRRHLKLSSRFYGPYTILQKIGQVAYKLDLPSGSKIHPVFHVSLLKRKLSEGIVPTSQLPELSVDGLSHIVLSAVLDRRSVTRGNVVITQWLVCWGDESLNLSSWEDEKFILKKFPNFDPWGQGSPNGGGIIMNTVGGGAAQPEKLLKVGKIEGGEIKMGFLGQELGNQLGIDYAAEGDNISQSG